MFNKVLGFDHGTNSGWCYGEKGLYVISGKEKFTDMNSRLVDMFNFAVSKITYFNPDVIAVEQVNSGGTKFGGGNIVTLASMRAMYILAAQMAHIQVTEVNPSTMKKVLTGYGRQDKKVMGTVASVWSGKSENEICTPMYFSSGKKKGQLKGYLADESDAICFVEYIFKK